MERGVLAIFAESNIPSSESLSSFVNFYNIPFFTWSYPNKKNEELNDKKFEAESTSSHDALTTDYSQDYYLTSTKPKIDDQKASQQEEEDSNEVNFLLNMHPSYTSVLISLIKYNRWQTIYYLYNHDEGKLLKYLIINYSIVFFNNEIFS